jgi:hypothetical protein
MGLGREELRVGRGQDVCAPDQASFPSAELHDVPGHHSFPSPMLHWFISANRFMN